MYNILIISPYFPPINTPDLHRVRLSLPYFRENGWHAEIVTVDAKYLDNQKDFLLLSTIPEEIKIHYVKVLNKNITSKFGLGSVALRSLWYYRKKVNLLLKEKKFDLIYFSTTQFPVCILGPYWKIKFDIPYVIDMQDPWHSEYYKNKPKKQQPTKYWFSYHLNKILEPIAMNNVGGLISVSKNYIDELKIRYPTIKDIPTAVIIFGASGIDLKIATNAKNTFHALLNTNFKTLVYVGRGGQDMHAAITPLFMSIKMGKQKYPLLFEKLKLYFIGTSYAPEGKMISTIAPLAELYGLKDTVIEMTTRISYFHSLSVLQDADALFIAGSDDPRYTASKIYPYLLTGKPLIAIFHPNSPANVVLKEYGVEHVFDYTQGDELIEPINSFLLKVINNSISNTNYNTYAVEKYSVKNLAIQQCKLFEAVLSHNLCG
jgi:hypothetical protein